MTNNKYYNEFFELGQQEIHFSLYDIALPSDDPVYTLKKVMDLNFTVLTDRYSNKGRKGYNPIMMYAVVTYANMRGVREVAVSLTCAREISHSSGLPKGKSLSGMLFMISLVKN